MEFPIEIILYIIDFLDGYEREQFRIVSKMIKPKIIKYDNEREAIRNREVHWVTFGANSLYFAVKFGHLDMVKVILRRVDNIQLAIRASCKFGHVEILRYLKGISNTRYILSKFKFTSLSQLSDPLFDKFDKTEETLKICARTDNVELFNKLYEGTESVATLAKIAIKYKSKRVFQELLKIDRGAAIYGMLISDSIEYIGDYTVGFKDWIRACTLGNINVMKYTYQFIQEDDRILGLGYGFANTYGKPRYKEIQYMFRDIEEDMNWNYWIGRFTVAKNTTAIKIAISKINVSELNGIIIPLLGVKYNTVSYIYKTQGKSLSMQSIKALIASGLNIKHNIGCISPAITGGCLDVLEYLLKQGITIEKIDVSDCILGGKLRALDLLLKYMPDMQRIQYIKNL